METFTKFVEWAKFTTYEFLAVLVPGAILLVAILPTMDSVLGAYQGVIALLISAWVLGLAVQGWARLVLGGWEKRLIDREAGGARAACAARIRDRLDSALEADAMDAYCLSAIGDRRADYEKFLALKDAARGIALALPSAFLILVVGRDDWSLVRPWGATLLVVAVAVGMLARWKRFASLSNLALYGEFLAAEEMTPKKEGADA